MRSETVQFQEMRRAPGEPAGNRQERHERGHAAVDRMLVIGMLGDMLSILAALLLSYWLRFLLELPKALGLPYTPAGEISFDDYLGYIVFGAATFLLCIAYAGAYQRNLILNWQKACAAVTRASVVWGVLFLATALTLRLEPPISRGFVGMGIAVSVVFLLAWRWLFHFAVSENTVAQRLLQRALFVGWTPEAARICVSLWQRRTEPVEIAGYVDFGTVPAHHAPPANVACLGGGLADLGEAIRRHGIDTVYLAHLNGSADEIIGISNLCERELVHFKIIPPYFRVLISGLNVETLTGFPVLSVSALPMDWLPNRIVKRAMDIAGGLAGLLLALPLMLACCALVYRESPGPLIFTQERVGRGGRLFKMRKLRTMRIGAEKSDHVNQSTVRDDPRVLKVGAFMRRWSLDELPQFWNVLAGDMSLVGPRPERAYHSHRLSGVIPHYNARYMAPPGLTGWAQINGLRGDTDLNERIRYDLFYVENWSVWFDVQILILTLFKAKNAY